MIPDYEISVSMEHVVKLKIGTIFANEEILEEYLSRFLKLILTLMSIIKNIQVDDNGKEYMLFRNDIYFTKYCLAVEIDEKGHTDRDLEFEKKDKRHQKKNLIVHLLELILVEKILMQTMKLVKYKYLSVNLKTIK